MKNKDVPGQIDLNPGKLLEKLDTWLDSFMKMLPNIAVAVVVFLIFWGLARMISNFVQQRAKINSRNSLGKVASSLVKWTLLIIGIMLAITIVVPSVKPGDLIAGLGVGSVAIGFAFKDILQNLLAGILILIRQPFEVGDQIISKNHEGTVEKIETRATFLKTYDGLRVVIPNSQIYTDTVVVKTAFKQIRSEYDIGVGCNDDWGKAKEIILAAAKTCEGVSNDPAPEVFAVAIADYSNNIRLRWWTESDRATVVHTSGRVIEAVYKELDANGIDMPYPTNVVLFHDQTDEHDGDRTKQREGWPAGEGNIPKAERIGQVLNRRNN